MRSLGLLSLRTTRRRARERLRIVRTERASSRPHFVERALAGVPGPPPRRIETTLDAALQREVAGIVDRHRARLIRPRRVQRRGGRPRQPHLRVAGLGRLGRLSRPGSRGRSTAWSRRVSPARPSKPFTLCALAFEQGYTPASVLPDLPSHFPTAVTGVLYSPRNYDGVFRGPLRVRRRPGRIRRTCPRSGCSPAPVYRTLLRVLRRVGLTTHSTKTPGLLRLRAHHGRRRRCASTSSWPLYARHRARRVVAPADGRAARRRATATGASPARRSVVRRAGDVAARAFLAGRRPLRRRRARLHLRRRRRAWTSLPGSGEDGHVRRPTTTTGRSASRATSRSGSGSATPTARRCRTRPGSRARLRSSTT